MPFILLFEQLLYAAEKVAGARNCKLSRVLVEEITSTWCLKGWSGCLIWSLRVRMCARCALSFTITLQALTSAATALQKRSSTAKPRIFARIPIMAESIDAF